MFAVVAEAGTQDILFWKKHVAKSNSIIAKDNKHKVEGKYAIALSISTTAVNNFLGTR